MQHNIINRLPSQQTLLQTIALTMNRSHEEMKSMSLGGILLDSCKAMYRARKVFSIILISLAIPLMLLASFRSAISPNIDPIIGNYSNQVFAAIDRYNSRMNHTHNNTVKFKKPINNEPPRNHTEFTVEKTNASYNSRLTNLEENQLLMLTLMKEHFNNNHSINYTQVSFVHVMHELVSGLVPDNPARVLLVLLFEIACFVFSLTAMLVLTSEVAHVIVSMHNSEELSCKKLFTVSPKIWRRLLVTYLCPYVFFGLGLVVLIVLTEAGVFFPNVFPPSIIFITMAMWVPLGLAFLGFQLVDIVFDVAVVVTALEGTCGVKAVKKSVALMKGNILAGAVIGILMIFVDYQRIGVMSRIWARSEKDVMGIGLWGIKVVSAFVLAIFVISVHTNFYMRCKAYHGEKIVTAAPSDCVGADMEYALLMSHY